MLSNWGIRVIKKNRQSICQISGIKQISRYRVMMHCSRVSVSTCFTSCRQQVVMEEPEWGQKDYREKAMKVIISGIRKCMCYRCLLTLTASWQRGCLITDIIHWMMRESVQGFWDIRKVHFTHGEPLTAKRHQPIIR